MKLSTPLCTLLFLASAALATVIPRDPNEPVSYDGVRVVRVQVDDTEAQAKKVEKLIDSLGLESWTHGFKVKQQVDVQVEPEKFDAFQKGLGGILYTMMHEDLGAAIRNESESSMRVGSFDVGTQADLSWFDSYHSYADHLSYYSQLVAQYPKNAKLVTAGTSYEGRPITGLHIFGSSGGGSKPAVILHGTVHAREWITTMVTEFIAYSLLSNYDNSTQIKGFVDKYDYYIFPVVNPDGFVFTQTSTRLWRKNRMPSSGSACIGTDINRNWDSHWAVSGGASTNPCAENYRGASAGSSPEFKALAAFQNRMMARQGVKFYMDIHAYSQLWMSPYGYTCDVLPTVNTELQSLAKGAVGALKAVYGTTYKYGPICNTIYPATGSSVDYSYDVSGIKYSYTAEMRDTGSYGFLLPADQIYPSGNEFWAAIKYMLQNMV